MDRNDRRGRAGRGGGVVPQLYALALRFLPPAIYARDGLEMEAVFTDLWRESTCFRRRTVVFVVVFTRLPRVVLVEWMDAMTRTLSEGRVRGQRRSGMTAWMWDLRLALRTLRRAPAFSITTVALLGLGIGAVTTIFTVVDHVLLRELPYPEQDRIIVLENGSHPGILFRDLEALHSVDLWAASWSENGTLVGEDEPLRITRTNVTRDFFPLFGARPSMGRLLVSADFSSPHVAVLGHGAWERIFGGDPDIVGRSLQVDGMSLQVVGVLGKEFVPPEGFTDRAGGTDIWVPLDWERDELDQIGYHVLNIAGRIAPGVALSDVEAETNRLAEELARRFPENRVDREGNTFLFPPAKLQEISTRRVRNGLGLLLGAVGLLLLVACLNVAHLFMARGLGRIRDMAVRRAVGARTGSLVRQLLVESLLLGFAGGVVGVALALVGLASLLSLNPTHLPWADSVSLDLRVFVFAGAISVGTVLVFGLVPAMRSVGSDLTRDLKGASRSSTGSRGFVKARNVLVVLEVALSLVLVAGAGLLLRSFVQVQTQDPGYEVEGVWTVPLTPTGPSTADEYRMAMDRVEASLAAVPGVSSATYGLALPFEFTGGGRCCWGTSGLELDGQERNDLRIALQPVTETYFETFGVDVIAGRIWTPAEGESDPWPVVLNEGFAVDLFGGVGAAVGRRVTLGGYEARVQVVGVVADHYHYGLDQAVPASAYLPMEKLPFPIPMAGMAVRYQGDDPRTLARALRKAVWDAEPTLPVPTVRSLRDWIEQSTAGRRFDGALFGLFGILALVLASAGLYGTLLYTVGQRRRELGIRIALGAARAGLQQSVVFHGLGLAILGCLIGLAGAWGAARFLESRLYELQATDPPTLLGAVGVLLAAAALASWLPARRASGVDPTEVLREE